MTVWYQSLEILLSPYISQENLNITNRIWKIWILYFVKLGPSPQGINTVTCKFIAKQCPQNTRPTILEQYFLFVRAACACSITSLKWLGRGVLPGFSEHLPIYLPIYLSTYLWFYSSCGPCTLFQFFNSHTVGMTHWTGISPSQGRYLHTGHQNHRINAYRYPCLSGIRTHDPSVWMGEDSSCLRLRGHCDRRISYYCSSVILNRKFHLRGMLMAQSTLFTVSSLQLISHYSFRVAGYVYYENIWSSADRILLTWLFISVVLFFLLFPVEWIHLRTLTF
jgi:hypothetical protein